jgi:hypothetical protein
MCNSCVSDDSTVYIVVIIIFVAILAKLSNYANETIIASVIGVLLILVGLRQILASAEHLETVRPVTNDTIQSDGIQNYNYDDNRFSEWGNISMDRDINTMEQRTIDLDIKANPAAGLDNSDLVEDAINKHSSNFQPDRAQGFSSTNSAYLSNMTLGEPDPYTQKLSYTVPLNDAAYNLDESLSRGQQYRASINKRAIDGAVRNTSRKFRKVFANELDENEKRVWYSAEAQDMESDFRPYY